MVSLKVLHCDILLNAHTLLLSSIKSFLLIPLIYQCFDTMAYKLNYFNSTIEIKYLLDFVTLIILVAKKGIRFMNAKKIF